MRYRSRSTGPNRATLRAMHNTVADTAAGPAARPPDPQPGWCPPERPDASHLTVRLKTALDVDALGEHLVRTWRRQGGRRRAGPVVELSVVETCGRNPAEREQDARRLLRLEARGCGRGAAGAALRATLVSLDSRDHLLLLATSDAGALLRPLVAELSLAYPLEGHDIG
jgi:hypothetical protein